MLLAKVDIGHRVLANCQPLPPGEYEVRLTDESLDPLGAGERRACVGWNSVPQDMWSHATLHS
jgi:hypothetical protein